MSNIVDSKKDNYLITPIPVIENSNEDSEE